MSQSQAYTEIMDRIRILVDALLYADELLKVAWGSLERASATDPRVRLLIALYKGERAKPQLSTLFEEPREEVKT